MVTKSTVSCHTTHIENTYCFMLFNNSSKVNMHVQHCQLSCGTICCMIYAPEFAIELFKYHIPAPVLWACQGAATFNHS